MKNDENKIINDLVFNLNKEIKKVAKIGDHSKLDNLFETIVNLDDKHKIYEEIINYYLNLLKDFEIYDMKVFSNKVEFISCLFDYAYFTYGDDETKQMCYRMQISSEYIADDLIAKCCNYNNRNFNLPLSLDIIKEYSINYEVKPNDMDKAIWWIILRLAVSLYILTDK